MLPPHLLQHRDRQERGQRIEERDQKEHRRPIAGGFLKARGGGAAEE